MNQDTPNMCITLNTSIDFGQTIDNQDTPNMCIAFSVASVVSLGLFYQDTPNMCIAFREQLVFDTLNLIKIHLICVLLSSIKCINH